MTAPIERDPRTDPQPGDIVEWHNRPVGEPSVVRVLGRRDPSDPTLEARHGAGIVVEVELLSGPWAPGDTAFMLHEWIAQEPRARVIERGSCRRPR